MIKKECIYVAPTAKAVKISAQTIICTSTEDYTVNSNGLGEDDFE